MAGPPIETRKIDALERTKPAKVQQFRLAVLDGPDAGVTYTSKGSRVVLGKHESADFVLRDETVSRFHCEIALSDEHGPILHDLGSRNGTLLDGVSVITARLRNGSGIHIGHTRLRFDLADHSVEIPLSDREQFGLLVGRSQPMRAVFSLLERIALSDATVLIEGETGTGKEAVAESLHREGPRQQGPFVVVDCGAIPPNLLESELFGHERGAYTGAIASRQGAFEVASGGTVFLDEVGELGPELQPKLLRVLERKEVKRLGGADYFPVDVRVIAATNRNLRSEVNAKNFRSDLYYRLAVVELRLPPLRERKADLPLLVSHLLAEMGVPQAEADRLATEEFLSQLERHSWLGNIRELRNYLECCRALHEHAPLPPSAPSAPLESLVDPSRPLSHLRNGWAQVERRYLEQVIEQARNNVSAAARMAGIDRVTFFRLLRRHGIR